MNRAGVLVCWVSGAGAGYVKERALLGKLGGRKCRMLHWTGVWKHCWRYEVSWEAHRRSGLRTTKYIWPKIWDSRYPDTPKKKLSQNWEIGINAPNVCRHPIPSHCATYIKRRTAVKQAKPGLKA